MFYFKKKKIVFLLLSLILIFIDQLSKILVLFFLNYQNKYTTIFKNLDFILMYNKGSALLKYSKLFFGQRYFLIILGFLTIINILNCNNLNYFLLLIFSGILSNTIDRIFYKHVIDFLYLHFYNFKSPIFNIADLLIIIGIIFISFKEILNIFKKLNYEKY